MFDNMACWLSYKPHNIEHFIWSLADPLVKPHTSTKYSPTGSSSTHKLIIRHFLLFNLEASEYFQHFYILNV